MEFLEKFGINPILLIAQVVNFTILLLLLRLFLYKPILKVLEDRKNKVEQSIKSAELIEKKLAKTQEDQEKLLEQARTEANKLINEAKAEAKELAEKTLTETKVTAEEMLAKNEQRLKLEKDSMMVEVRKEIAELVTTAAAKVTKKSMTETDNKKLVDESIKELTQK